MTAYPKPSLIARPSPNHGSRYGVPIDVVLLHHTAGKTDEADLEWMCKPVSQASAHYLVGRDGKVYQLVQDSRAAWHAGLCALKGQRTNMNRRSIGVEISNRGDGVEPYTEAQYLALEQLVPYLMQTYKVPMDQLLGHKDVAIPTGRKTDPSPNFDFERVRRAVSRARNFTPPLSK